MWKFKYNFVDFKYKLNVNPIRDEILTTKDMLDLMI